VQKMSIKALPTAGGRARAHLAVEVNCSLDHPPKAAPSWLIEVDDRIGPGQANGEGAREISVHNPTVAGDEFRDGFRPGILGIPLVYGPGLIFRSRSSRLLGLFASLIP